MCCIFIEKNYVFLTVDRFVVQLNGHCHQIPLRLMCLLKKLHIFPRLFCKNSVHLGFQISLSIYQSFYRYIESIKFVHFFNCPHSFLPMPPHKRPSMAVHTQSNSYILGSLFYVMGFAWAMCITHTAWQLFYFGQKFLLG